MTLGGPGSIGQDDPVAGLLGQILGESKVDQKARIEEATKNANDLTGLVRKKKPKPESTEGHNVPTELNISTSATNGKRKLEAEEEDGSDGKRAKKEVICDAGVAHVVAEDRRRDDTDSLGD